MKSLVYEEYKHENDSFLIKESRFGGYDVWKNGCRISDEDICIEDARELIYDRIVGGMQNDIDDAERHVKSLKKELINLLTNNERDVFNLRILRI